MERVEVTSADIARMAGVRPTAVSNWRRRHTDFPEPVAGTDRSPRFDLAQIEAWLTTQGRANPVHNEERLWRALDTARGAEPWENALAIIGLFLMHRTANPDAELVWQATGVSNLILAAEHGLLSDSAVGSGVVAMSARDPLTVPDSMVKILERVEAAAHELSAPALFEALCSRYQELGPRSGLAFTPPELAQLMLDLAGSAEGTLADLACGSGTVLMAAAQRGFQRVLGQEVSAPVARLCAVRLAVNNLAERRTPFDVHAGDSLRRPAYSRAKARAVVTYPPFAERNWGFDELADDPRWIYGTPPRLEPELAWVQQALDMVQPGGTAVVLMPPAAALRASGRRVRQELLTQGALRAVISLPQGLATHYSLALQIWVLTRPDLPRAQETLLVVDAADAGRTIPQPRQGTDGQGKTQQIWQQVRELVADIWSEFHNNPHGFDERPGVARAVPLAEVLDSEVNVSPRRYLPPTTTASSIEVEASYEKLADLVKRLDSLLPPPYDVPRAGSAYMRVVPLDDLVEAGAVFIRRTAPGPSSTRRPASTPTQTMIEARILTGQDLATGVGASRTGEVDADELHNPPIRLGDVLVPAVATRLVARVATAEDAGAYAASSVLVVRTDHEMLDPWYLAGFLSSTEGGRQAERLGSSLRGAIRTDLRRVRIPLPPIDIQRHYAERQRQWAEFGRALSTAHELGGELIRHYYDAIASTAAILPR